MEKLALHVVGAVLVYEAHAIEEHAKGCGRCGEAQSYISGLLNQDHFNNGYFLYEPFTNLSEENIVVCANCKTRYHADPFVFLEA